MTQYFKLTILFLLSFIALSHYSFAEIIPADKRINWSPGIPGGIPNYSATRNAVTQHGAVGDGITDDTFAIQSCINALTSMQVCYLPPGTYKVTSQLNMFTAQTALRGAGANSKIISYSPSGDIINMGSGSEGSLINISSGYTKDSTSLTFADAATISSILVGDYIVVVQSNDSFVDPTGYNGCTYCGLNDDETKAMNQIVRVTNKVDNILTIHKPLYFTFQASLTPQIIEFGMKTNIGVEDIYIENDSSTSNQLRANINIGKCAYCWVENIESYNANMSHVRLQEAYGAEIRDSKFSYGHAYDGDHAYGAFIFVTNSDHLIENNIFYHLRHSMILEGGGSGNVYGYNYSNRMFGDVDPNNTNWLMADIVTHGAHPYMNLFEGNVAQHLGADYTHGSGSHNTFFRNQITRENLNYDNTLADQHLFAVDISKFNYYLNVVGNVLGKSSQTFNAYEDSGTRINY